MKRKLLLFNASMGLLILCAILVQSFHAVEHLAKQFSEKKCLHKYNHHQTEVSHGHDGLEKCFVCEFAFSNYTSLDQKSFEFRTKDIVFSYSFFYAKEVTQKFRGSLFALRAPPVFIV